MFIAHIGSACHLLSRPKFTCHLPRRLSFLLQQTHRLYFFAEFRFFRQPNCSILASTFSLQNWRHWWLVYHCASRLELVFSLRGNFSLGQVWLLLHWAVINQSRRRLLSNCLAHNLHFQQQIRWDFNYCALHQQQSRLYPLNISSTAFNRLFLLFFVIVRCLRV